MLERLAPTRWHVLERYPPDFTARTARDSKGFLIGNSLRPLLLSSMKSVRENIGGLGNILFKNAYIWAQFREGKIPDVYVQSEKYFAKYGPEIRQLYGQGIGYTDKIALHIRRGDYLKVSQFHLNLWDTDYYYKAVKLFPHQTFLIFCKDNQSEAQDKDDREWCENNIPQLGIKFELHNHTTETEDLNVMASCKGIIGANSSFSWWAAYLSPHEGDKVFPKNWFVDGVQRTEMLDEWIKI